MVLDAFKKYPSQISSAFRRFPVASALAFFTFFALVYSTEHTEIFDRLAGMRFLAWLGIYPIAAMLISLTTSLVQESLKNESKLPQAITGGAWFVFSLFLTFAFSMDVSWANYYLVATASFIYITATFGIFIAPFWKDKDENAFWIFLFKNLKALVVAALIAALLLASVEALVFCFGALFEHDFDEKVYFYIFYFCASAVFPILYFSGIPAIEDCHSETPALNKFATSTIKFLFVPVLSLAILLFYAYIVKFIVLWDMPQGMVSYFVSGFMLYMLALVTVLYPARLSPGSTFEKKLLKIFPTACIPLVAMMSVGLVRRISDYGISPWRLYVVGINIFFYIIIAIFLIDKIKCKSRYIAVIFCAIFFVITDTPLNASNISHRVWMGSIKAALVEQGYTEFPLNDKDTREFLQKLKDKDDKNAKLVITRLVSIGDSPLNNPTYYSLANYLSTKDRSLFSLLQIYGVNNLDCTDDDIICDKDSIDKEPFESFEVSIEYPDKALLQVPRGTKGAVAIDHYFNNDEFEFTGDTLTFRLSLKEDTGCSCNSDSTDACKEAPAPVYSFTVDRQTLKQDSIRQIKADGATFGIKYLHAEEESKSSKTLRIRGILFTE
ncbi:DUF4153 domain-containing protein [Fibrobacter succinogenes]|uniref:DUF4153 domain-containing protein n=1 Tax=Fibrobacter succinogenes TaxID=833 RepID=UPI0015658FDF|nr:DUF4153 domain-containing protein [Fibrobacter succinogenes]